MNGDRLDWRRGGKSNEGGWDQRPWTDVYILVETNIIATELLEDENPS